MFTFFIFIRIILSKNKLRFDKFDKVLLFIYCYGLMTGLFHYAFGYGNLHALINDALLIFQTYFIFVAIKNSNITPQVMQMFLMFSLYQY